MEERERRCSEREEERKGRKRDVAAREKMEEREEREMLRRPSISSALRSSIDFGRFRVVARVWCLRVVVARVSVWVLEIDDDDDGCVLYM